MGTSNEIDMGVTGGVFPDAQMDRVVVSANELVVHFGLRSITLPAVWLRDNCRCTECRIVQTDERRVLPWSVAHPAIGSASLHAGVLTIEWADGHQSQFADSTWRTIDQAMHRGPATARLWRAGDSLERLAHRDVMNDTGTRAAFFEAFQRDGAAVVTHSPTTEGSVLDFMHEIGVAVRELSVGRIFDVKLDPAGWNVAYTSEAVPPHNDFANYTNPPSGQVLAMLVNDATGGHSMVVDGWQVLTALKQLDPAALDVLARVRVGFRQYSPTADVFSRTTLVERDSDGRFTHLRFSNQLMQPLPFDHPDLVEWYRAYRLLGAMVDEPANQIAFRLDAGDMLFVNNHRVLHAREAFVPDGARHLQDIYFDADEIVGNLARLTGAAQDAMVPS